MTSCVITFLNFNRVVKNFIWILNLLKSEFMISLKKHLDNFVNKHLVQKLNLVAGVM